MYSWKIIVTEDGSHSVQVPELNETYHSVHGALTESRLVYIKNGFRYLISLYDPKQINILEIGLGTGLNVLLSVMENRKFSRNISYTAIEPYPLPESILSELNYPANIGGEETMTIFNRIHSCAWNEPQWLEELFSINKIDVKYQNYIPRAGQFNLIYYDAFGPGKQPEIWELAVLRKTADGMAPSGILVTYAAQGQLKRDLKALGLQVETLQGPPGKKEMLRALRPSLIQ